MAELLGPLYVLNLPYIQRALAGETQVFERTVPQPDGGARESLATYTPDVQGGVVRGFFVQVADVTGLRRSSGDSRPPFVRSEPCGGCCRFVRTARGSGTRPTCGRRSRPTSSGERRPSSPMASVRSVSTDTSPHSRRPSRAALLGLGRGVLSATREACFPSPRSAPRPDGTAIAQPRMKPGTSGGTMVAVASHVVEGHVSRGFEAVRDAFEENFARRGELGGACCAYHRGEKVVDLWGGVRNKATGEPWERDTMVVVHSATKGLAAMTLAIAHSRGWLDYEERVASVLAGVRAERQGEDHRAPAARASGRPVRLRRTGRSQRGRGPGPAGGGHGPSEAGVGARHATGVSRADPRVLRRRADAPRGSPASHAWGSSFRTRSRRRLERTSTSGCPKRSRTLVSPPLSPPDDSQMLIGFRPCDSCSRG